MIVGKFNDCYIADEVPGIAENIEVLVGKETIPFTIIKAGWHTAISFVTDSDFRIITKTNAKRIIKYVSSKKNFRDLTVEEFEALGNKDFRSFYEPVEETYIKENEHDYEIVEYSTDFDAAVFAGEKKFSTLTNINARYDARLPMGLSAFKPTAITQNTLETLLRRREPTAKTSVVSCEYASIKVQLLEKEYTGATRKIMRKKKNGSYYADGRGYYVPDYGEIVASAEISYANLAAVVNTRINDSMLDPQRLIVIEEVLKELSEM